MKVKFDKIMGCVREADESTIQLPEGTQFGILTIGGYSPDSSGNFNLTVNGQSPNSSGDITLSFPVSVNGQYPDYTGNITLASDYIFMSGSGTWHNSGFSLEQTIQSLETAIYDNTSGTVKSVCGVGTSDSYGNVNLTAANIYSDFYGQNIESTLTSLSESMSGTVKSVCGVGTSDSSGDVNLTAANIYSDFYGQSIDSVLQSLWAEIEALKNS